MDDKSAGRRGGWRLRAVASGAAAAVLLGGCSVGASKRAAEPGGKASGSPTPSASASGQVSAEGAKPSATPSVTPFEADPDRVPRSTKQGAALAKAVAMRPQDWGAGFRAQPLARSAEGTAAVLDDECRWQRRVLPDGVLASLSLYSELPGTGKLGTVKAAATVHTKTLGAQLPDLRPDRVNRRILGRPRVDRRTVGGQDPLHGALRGAELPVEVLL